MLDAKMKKILYMLIGPKGSGKTYIGTLIENNTSIVFLRVEPIWLNLLVNENGWDKVEAEIDNSFEKYNEIMIENLGIGDGFNLFHRSLKRKYNIKMIRVFSDLDTCFKRVQFRDKRNHIPISDDKVHEYNTIASQVSFNWSLIIDNNGPATDSEIIEMIKSI
jgi:hypothetical protein